MVKEELAAEVAAAATADVGSFDERVAEEAAALKEAIAEGTFDNPQAIVGLEYEFYGIDRSEQTLIRVPRFLLEHVGFQKELGLHNAEMNTSPQPLNEFGLSTQETELQGRLEAARAATREEDIELVSDGLWTVPPIGESARQYLTESVEYDGVRLGVNMSDAVRYHAMANSEYEPRCRIDVPNVTLTADTVMPESLTTSVQPHYQVPHARDLPRYFRYAVRAAGPLLALGVNSPFFPPDCYDADATPEAVLAEHAMEHRIDVFEGAMNATDRPDKVRFPADVESVEEAVDRVAADETIVPMDVPETDRYDDAFRRFRHKHGSYWRWVRPVFEGATRAEANARIEFRAIPAQPTVRDAVAVLALFAGLMEGFVSADHPVERQPWDRARRNFENARDDGLGADLAWITADGEETADIDVIYDDLFAVARDGLESRGLDRTVIDQYLRPLRGRVVSGTTPARWKHEAVRRRVEDGAALEAAIHGMQRSYFRHQADTLVRGTFLDWLPGGRV